MHKPLRKIQLFKEDDLFTIRHFRSSGHTFDDVHEDEISFLKAVGVFLYTSEGSYDVQVERELEPLVVSYLAGVIDMSNSKEKVCHF